MHDQDIGRINKYDCIRMLEDYWYPIALSAELQSKPLQRHLFGNALVLIRSGESISCFQNSCPHRNAPLSMGSVRNGKLRCAYHGWEFNADGNLSAIPSLTAESVLPQKCLTRYSVLEKDGLIWCTLNKKNPDHTPFEWPKYIGYSSFELVNLVQAPMDLVLENFVDCAHTPFVHKGFFRTPGRSKICANMEFRSTGLLITSSGETKQKSLLGYLIGEKNSEAIMHTDEYIIPSTVKVDYKWSDRRHICSVSICSPVHKQATMVFTRIYLKSSWLQTPIAYFVKSITKKILSQDKEILSAQAQVIENQGSTNFTSVASDAPINFLRKIYSSLVEGNFDPRVKRNIKTEYQL